MVGLGTDPISCAGVMQLVGAIVVIFTVRVANNFDK